MKLDAFTIERETDKALMVTAFVVETNKEESFWLPKSKFKKEGDSLEIDDDFWPVKLEEIKNPPEEPTAQTNCKDLEEGEKATKLIIPVQLGEKINIDLFVWLPNSTIISVEKKGSEDAPYYCVTSKEWAWDNAYDKALEHQLEFFNKEDKRFGKDDFTRLPLS